MLSGEIAFKNSHYYYYSCSRTSIFSPYVLHPFFTVAVLKLTVITAVY